MGSSNVSTNELWVETADEVHEGLVVVAPTCPLQNADAYVLGDGDDDDEHAEHD